MSTLTTRIAPSPTGYFHLGTARTAYFNWLAARATGGTFILRIDDTDATRNDNAMVKVIHDAMSYLGLDYDTTFKQSDVGRQQDYVRVMNSMIENGTAELRDGAVYLLPTDYPKEILDLTGVKIRETDLDREYIPRMVLMKSNGSPTYHFASVVDDMMCGVNMVIRGADHVANTIKQVAIYAALNAPLPKYAHVGLLHSMDGKKLSKSTGAKSLLDYRDEGINADAMLNFLLRLGWAPKVDDKSTATINRARALELFLTAGNLRNQPAKVDFAKLDSFNRKYKAMVP